MTAPRCRQICHECLQLTPSLPHLAHIALTAAFDLRGSVMLIETPCCMLSWQINIERTSDGIKCSYQL